MSLPTSGYQALEIEYQIESSTVMGYAIAFRVGLQGLDSQYHEEIAQILEDAAEAMKAAVETAHPTWTVVAYRRHHGIVSDTV